MARATARGWTSRFLPDNMVASIDIEREFGHLPRGVTGQESGARSDILDGDEVVGWRPFSRARQQLVEPVDAGRGARRHGSGERACTRIPLPPSSAAM